MHACVRACVRMCVCDDVINLEIFLINTYVHMRVLVRLLEALDATNSRAAAVAAAEAAAAGLLCSSEVVCPC